MLIWNYRIHNWQYVRSKFCSPNYRDFSVTLWPNFRKRIHNHDCSHWRNHTLLVWSTSEKFHTLWSWFTEHFVKNPPNMCWYSINYHGNSPHIWMCALLQCIQAYRWLPMFHRFHCWKISTLSQHSAYILTYCNSRADWTSQSYQIDLLFIQNNHSRWPLENTSKCGQHIAEHPE